MTRPASRRRARFLRALLAAVCLAGLGWAVWTLGPREVGAVAARADPWWLALSVLPISGRFLIWGVKWRRMLCRHAPVRYGLALRILAVGSVVNLTTPTAKLAGGFVRAALLRRRLDWPLTTAYGWAMADQVTNVLGHMLLGGLLALGVGFGVADAPGRNLFLVGGAAVLAAIGAGAMLRGWAWELLRRPWVDRRLGQLLPARIRGGRESAELLRRVFAPLLREGTAAGAFLPDLLWAAAAFGSLCLANAMVLRALGVAVPLVVASMVVVLGYFAGVVVGVWGGVGVTEAALTGLYVQFGIPLEQAAAATLLHRALFYAVVFSWGGFAWWRDRLDRRPPGLSDGADIPGTR